MQLIQLPARVTNDWHILDLVKKLGSGNAHVDVQIDFRNVEFYVPAALAFLIAKVQGWLRESKNVSFTLFGDAPAFQYLQRIDFFTHNGIVLEEAFRRHNPAGRFLPITQIGRGTSAATDIAERAARCIAPDLADSWDADVTGPFDYVEYSISELVNNVVQHSGGIGFINAQFTPSSDTTRLAIADCGMGISKSFQQSGSPHWKCGMTDIEAIKLALQPRVSSKTHMPTAWGESINAGVGLTMLWELANRVGGEFLLVSGQGFVTREKSVKLEVDDSFHGTLCAISFPRSKITNFFRLLDEAKMDAGLLPRDDSYSELFE